MVKFFKDYQNKKKCIIRFMSKKCFLQRFQKDQKVYIEKKTLLVYCIKMQLEEKKNKSFI